MIKALRAANDAYNDKITFVYVDWDTYRDAPIARKFKVPYQSTLVLLGGKGEIGRLVAQTNMVKIKALLDSAL